MGGTLPTGGRFWPAGWDQKNKIRRPPAGSPLAGKMPPPPPAPSEVFHNLFRSPHFRHGGRDKKAFARSKKNPQSEKIFRFSAHRTNNNNFFLTTIYIFQMTLQSYVYLLSLKYENEQKIYNKNGI